MTHRFSGETKFMVMVIAITFFIAAFIGGAFVSQMFKHGWLLWDQTELGFTPEYTCKLVQK